MNNWPYRPVSDFLVEREGKYKPNDTNISEFKRLEKIDFKGQIHISEKPSKTNMIIVEPGDLVISGINVSKGALAVYEGTEPVVATIHYSSYIFDRNKIDIDFLKKFLKSPAFITELQNQVKGGIKTEIKPKHLLPLQVRIPEITHQKKVNLHFDSIEDEIADLSNEIQGQSSYLTQLRQAILQEAIEGKLTADWRKENPVRKGDPDYDAEALLDRIKAEKEKMVKEGKIRKQKPLAPIKPEEAPFELPEGWVWTRLLDLSDAQDPNPSHRMPKKIENGVPFISPVNVNKQGEIDFENGKKVSPEVLKYQKNLFEICKHSFAFSRIGTIGIVFKLPLPQNYCLSYSLSVITPYLTEIENYLMNAISSNVVLLQALSGTTNNTIPDLGMTTIRSFLVPLPPLAEQQVLIDRVEKLLSMVDELEKQVVKRKEHSEQLMKAVLREAFEGDKEVSEVPSNLEKSEKTQKVTPFQQMQLIATVIDILENYSQHQGEMIIAKYLYILAFVSHMHTGFQFKQWHFGPYDSAIKKRINNRNYFSRHGKKGFETYSVLKKETLFKYSNSMVAEAENTLPGIVEIFSGTRDVEKRDHKIELLATVLKTMEDSGKTEPEEVYYEMAKWQTDPELTGFTSKAEKFSEQEVANCIKFVKKEGWI